MFKRGDKVRHILGYEGTIVKELPPEIGQQIAPYCWKDGDVWYEMKIEDTTRYFDRILRSPSYELTMV